MADQAGLDFNIEIESQNRNEPVSDKIQNSKATQNVNNNNQEGNINNQEQSKIGAFAEIIKNAAHPILCLVFICFKVAAVASFILLDLFTRDAIAYLAVIIIGSADFWYTKNIAGRMLVGLRWWNEVKEDGTEVWIFESKNESILFILFVEKEHKGDSTVFWTGLYINGGVWAALFIWDLIRLRFVWGLIAFILLIFAGTNIYGYVKCSKDQQSNLLKFGAKTVLKAAEKGADVAAKSSQV